MTVKGVKKLLNKQEPLKLDESLNNHIKASDFKNKITKISNLVKKFKKFKIKWQKKTHIKVRLVPEEKT